MANEQDGWEKVNIQVDSGAIDTLAPKGVAVGVPIREAKAAKLKMGYVAAKGTKIENHGERVLKGVTDEGLGVKMEMQVADVKRSLASVYRMKQAGNGVVFGGSASYVRNKQTGSVTPIIEENGKYVFNIWIKQNSVSSQKPGVGRANENRFAALAEREEPRESGFSWRDEIF